MLAILIPTLSAPRASPPSPLFPPPPDPPRLKLNLEKIFFCCSLTLLFTVSSSVCHHVSSIPSLKQIRLFYFSFSPTRSLSLPSPASEEEKPKERAVSEANNVLNLTTNSDDEDNIQVLPQPQLPQQQDPLQKIKQDEKFRLDALDKSVCVLLPQAHSCAVPETDTNCRELQGEEKPEIRPTTSEMLLYLLYILSVFISIAHMTNSFSVDTDNNEDLEAAIKASIANQQLEKTAEEHKNIKCWWTSYSSMHTFADLSLKAHLSTTTTRILNSPKPWVVLLVKLNLGEYLHIGSCPQVHHNLINTIALPLAGKNTKSGKNLIWNQLFVLWCLTPLRDNLHSWCGPLRPTCALPPPPRCPTRKFSLKNLPLKKYPLVWAALTNGIPQEQTLTCRCIHFVLCDSTNINFPLTSFWLWLADIRCPDCIKYQDTYQLEWEESKKSAKADWVHLLNVCS